MHPTGSLKKHIKYYMSTHLLLHLEGLAIMFRLLSVFFIAFNCECKILNPVILVPGDGGSQLEAKLNKSNTNHLFCERNAYKYFTLWVNLEELYPFVIDCLAENMRLVYDTNKHITRNFPGVQIRVPGWGDTETVEWLDPVHHPKASYFSPIVNAMVKWGYKRNVSVRGAPYDFRKAPNEFASFYKSFRVLVEETYAQNNNTRVVLIGHSMGNPTTLYFLNHQPQSWKDKFIQSFISLAGVWGGSVKSLKLLASGDNLNWFWDSSFILNMRQQQRSMPSTAWLMPSDMFWGKDEILIERPGMNYTVNDYKQFFRDINFMDGWDMRQDTKYLVRSLTPPGVEVHCLHGYNVSTAGKLVYKDNMWPDTQPDVTQDDGDGTVNIRSLKGCSQWQGKQPQNVYYHPIEGVSHMEILGNKDIIDYLKGILTEADTAPFPGYLWGFSCSDFLTNVLWSVVCIFVVFLVLSRCFVNR